MSMRAVTALLLLMTSASVTLAEESDDRCPAGYAYILDFSDTPQDFENYNQMYRRFYCSVSQDVTQSISTVPKRECPAGFYAIGYEDSFRAGGQADRTHDCRRAAGVDLPNA